MDLNRTSLVSRAGELRTAGVTVDEIAKELCVSRSSASNYAREALAPRTEFATCARRGCKERVWQPSARRRAGRYCRSHQALDTRRNDADAPPADATTVWLARVQAGLTRKELASALGDRDATLVAAVEHGARTPSEAKRLAWAAALGCDERDLFPDAPPIEPIARLRISRGADQGDLADLLGVTIPRVSQLENAVSFPSYDQAVKLADFFGVEIDNLLPDGVTFDRCPCGDVDCDWLTAGGRFAPGHVNKVAHEAWTSTRCDLCRRTVRRPTLELQRSEKAKRRTMCADCLQGWRVAAARAGTAAGRAPNRRTAFTEALRIGQEFEREIDARRADGRPASVAVDIVIEALHVTRKCSDADVAVEFKQAGIRGVKIRDLPANPTAEWVKTRRKRRGIYRAKARAA